MFSGLAFLTAVGLLGQPTVASATTPGTNGQISFMRMDGNNGHWQIWTANPDLTVQHQLTAGIADNGWATWSPDGTDVRQVTHLGFYAGQPTWSRDGQWIAFTTDGGNYPTTQGIYVIHPDGTGLRQVVALPSGPRSVWLDAPRFSPDGTQLAYTFFEGGRETPAHWSWKGETSSLWVVNLDGTSAHMIVGPGQKVGDADWSPDGRHLVFEQNSNDPGRFTSVLRVPAAGGGITALTHDTGLRGGRSPNWSFQASFDPVYSPDGTKILFPHDEYAPGSGCTSLQVMNADGTDQHWVNNACGVEHQVDWGTAPLE